MIQHRMTAQSRRNLEEAELAFVEQFGVQRPRYAIRWAHGERVGYAHAGDSSIMLYGSRLAAERALARARGVK